MKETHRDNVLAVVLPVVALVAAIVSVQHEPKPPWKDGDFSPYGYTMSLALFLVPTISLSTWFLQQRHARPLQWRAFGIAAAIIVPTWCLLDILLGNTFFVFPNPGATLQIFAPGYAFGQGWLRNIPIEEFAFYILGCFTILLGYIWASESWLSAYTLSQEAYLARVRTVPRLVNIHVPSALAGIAIFIGALAWKKLGPHSMHDGFPGYFLFELALVIGPIAMLNRTIGPFINHPAFIYKTLSLLLVSLLWEVTLALPYGWWGYRYEQMMGLTIHPWFNLPVEAALLWPCAALMNVFIYEAARFYLNAHRPLMSVLFGSGSEQPLQSPEVAAQ